MEQFGEDFYTRLYERINKPWVKALFCLIGTITCGFCCCFGCCFCCCCFCFGKCRPKTDDDGEFEYRETNITVEEDVVTGTTLNVVSETKVDITSSVEKVDETADKKDPDFIKNSNPSTNYGAI